MGRKKPIPKRSPWRPAALVAATLGLAVGVALAVVWAGEHAGSAVAKRPRYSVPFADIECDPPPGLTRPTFLAEVRALASLPVSVAALDPESVERVRKAFAAHPWVAAVDACGPSAGRKFQVKLSFRVPVLRVRAGGVPRLVDAAGVLLPAGATGNVCELANAIDPPAPADGKRWENDTVRRAAELAADPQFAPVRVERIAAGWRLTRADGSTLRVSR